MAKLGKKARKFARKNLQSVLRNRRKFKAKKESARRRARSNISDEEEEHEQPTTAHLNREIPETAPDAIYGNILSEKMSDDEDGTIEDASDSDGYLPEDPSCPYISESEDESTAVTLAVKKDYGNSNADIYLELMKQAKKLNVLKKKEPCFAEFLDAHKHAIEMPKIQGYCSDDEYEESDMSQASNPGVSGLSNYKFITSYTLDVWFWLVIEHADVTAFTSILNGYRAASHYSIDKQDESLKQRIQDPKLFSKLLVFVLSEADGVFRRILGVSSSCPKESILNMKNSSGWKTARPLIKSYLRSTLFLLSQLTDNKIIAFALSRLRVSVTFFAAFPALSRRLLKIGVHFWAAREDELCRSSFLVIKDMAIKLNSEFRDTCMDKILEAFIKQCKFIGPHNLKHTDYLGKSILELYSIDIFKSYPRVLNMLNQLANELQNASKTKTKEKMKSICSWQCIKTAEICVNYITSNFKDYDMQPLFHLVIQILYGVVHLFRGPRYLPLRLKCVQMLNQLSCSCGVFIPVAYLVLDFLECIEAGKAVNKLERSCASGSLLSVLKVPKQWLKSLNFQEECILSAIELLSAHFQRWSLHISFPDLATIPLIAFSRFCEKTTNENGRRLVKRFIDQVEQNVEFVQQRREVVSFSPNDQASAETFLQLENSGRNLPFSMYYDSIKQKFISRTKGVK